ncbi:hypothetical protein BGW80DRAFT_1257643 [Lactifluus volemus]|nr:hypothetical protein BGW80DRAFT_1257643 [Lactifluus volemus]
MFPRTVYVKRRPRPGFGFGCVCAPQPRKIDSSLKMVDTEESKGFGHKTKMVLRKVIAVQKKLRQGRKWNAVQLERIRFKAKTRQREEWLLPAAAIMLERSDDVIWKIVTGYFDRRGRRPDIQHLSHRNIQEGFIWNGQASDYVGINKRRMAPSGGVRHTSLYKKSRGNHLLYCDQSNASGSGWW